MNVREGMKVMVIHHMSNKGIVTKVYFTPVKSGLVGGTFSKQMRVKFISEIKGYGEQDFAKSDLMILNDE
jgi:hypothetical protein